MASVLLELRRGVLMKLLGLAAKAAFVIVFSQKLGSGEFSRYFIGFSTSLIVARFLGMGGDDELPFRVSGRRSTAGRYASVAVAFTLMACVLCLGSLLAGAWRFEIAALSISMFLAGSSFATGALRSISNFYQEFRANVPWIIVCALVAVFPFHTAEDVLYGIASSYVVVHLIEFTYMRRDEVRLTSQWIPVLLVHVKRIADWFPKAISTAAIAASLRAFPLWIGWLNLGATDQLAYAFAIGEVSFQIAMTYVNLVHSSRKLRQSAGSSFWVVMLIFVLVASGTSSALYFFLAQVATSKTTVGFEMLLYSSYYAVSIALFSLVRVGVWGRDGVKRALYALVGVQGLMYVIPGVLVAVYGFRVHQIAVCSLLNVFLIAAFKKGLAMTKK